MDVHTETSMQLFMAALFSQTMYECCGFCYGLGVGTSCREDFPGMAALLLGLSCVAHA